MHAAPLHRCLPPASDLVPRAQYVRLISVLEPSFEGGAVGQYFTFDGFLTDGVPTAPSAPRARNIELVGDSISAGYGSRGYAGAPLGCPVDDATSGNYYTCVRTRGVCVCVCSHAAAAAAAGVQVQLVSRREF